MKLEEVKKRVEFFEDRILHNFETHFSDLVLDDFYGGGHRDRISDEWFYDEYFEQYESDIIELLLKIEHEDEQYYDLQLRLIKLKRIIDTKLIKLGKSPTHTKPLRQYRITYFLLKENIDQKKFVSLLFDKLINSKFINCKKEEFKQLFEEVDNRVKIQWKGTEPQITLLINSLLGYFDSNVSKEHYKLTSNLFINRFGEKFKPKQLGSVYSEKVDLTKPNDTIFKILEGISTHFPLS